MAKGLHRLTTKQVENAKPGSAPLNDGGGLCLRTSAGGASRWVFRFTSNDPDYLQAQRAKGSKLAQREMGLGTFGAGGVTLALAREKAAEARAIVARGHDPIREAERAEQAAAIVAASVATAVTFGRYADETFLPYVLPGYSNAAHIDQWKATFKTHAASLRDKPLASITRRDVLAVLAPIWTGKNETAARSRGRIERLFAHAIQNGHFTGDNPAAWGQFDATLTRQKEMSRGHHSSIPHEEIAAFIAALRLRQEAGVAALMLEWIALSACRTGDARFAVWSEFDFERAIWSIPAARMKMRRAHYVPLTPRMVAILVEAKRHHVTEPRPGTLVFVNSKGKALSEMAGLMLLRRMEDYADFTVHGLRSTFKGWAATETEFARELIEEQLAHQLGAVERAYMRVSAVERRRAMMLAWESHLNGDTPAGATIVPFKAAKSGTE